MSAPARTFVIRATAGCSASHTDLLALAQDLRLWGDDRVQVTLVGDELRVTLTTLGMQVLKGTSR